MTLKHRSPVVLLAAILACFSAGAAAAEKAKITSPKEEFGFQLGDDYCLANYQQLSAYWRKLARESDRLKVEVIGVSEEGADTHGDLTAARNHKQRAATGRFPQAGGRRGSGRGSPQARRRRQGRGLDRQGPAAHEIRRPAVDGDHVPDGQPRRRGDAAIFSATWSSSAVAPTDGLDLVSDWYMRGRAQERSLSRLPRLYQNHIGHDNNRDFMMVTQKESEAVRVFFHRVVSQIIAPPPVGSGRHGDVRRRFATPSTTISSPLSLGSTWSAKGDAAASPPKGAGVRCAAGRITRYGGTEAFARSVISTT